MFEKKLSKEEVEELTKKAEMINQYVLIAQALEMMKQIYLKKILPKYGIDPDKNYEINLKTGKITKVKEEKQKEEKTT